MNPDSKRRIWLAVVVVVAAALAFAGPSTIAGINDTAVASSGCELANNAPGGGCGMMQSANCAGTCPKQLCKQGCAVFSGTVTAVDQRNGSVTVTIKPATVGVDAAKKLLAQVKVGDKLPMAMMLGNDGRPAAGQCAAVQGAKCACPACPGVTSDTPCKCSKCGMKR